MWYSSSMRTLVIATLLGALVASCAQPNMRMSSPGVDLALLQDAVEPSDPPNSAASAASPGGLRKSEIAAVYAPAMKDIKGCYERGLNRNGDLAGTVKTRSIIKSDGSVLSAEVESTTLADAEVESCIVGVIKRLQFPKPAGGGQVLVTYPFVFSSSSTPTKARGACGFP